ncbi:MAG: methyl-accepting chemotaxis protein, partial [Comamonadaceae bacterium]
ERGSTLVGQAGERVANTVRHVDQVVELISEIQGAGQEQARGIAQIGEAVRQLDVATQQNAALVDDSSSASTGMKNQARRLLDVIRQFQLGPQAAAAGDEPLRLPGADTAVQPRLSMAPR